MKKSQISENTSVYAYTKKQIAKLLKIADFKELTESFIKYSILITLFTYFIGTILLLFRSWCEKIPFVPLDIIQIVIIDVYFLITLIIFFTCEYWICEIWYLIRRSNRKTSEKMFGRFLSVFIIIITIAMTAFIISLFTKNFLSTVVLFSIPFLLLPGYFHLFMTRLSLKATIFIECSFIFLFAYFFVCNIPMSMGGLAPQSISYCIEDDLCHEYNYFGNHDGMLILKDDNAVILEPISRGYIKYEQFDKTSKTTDTQ